MTAEYARTEWDRALEAFRAATLLLAHGGFHRGPRHAYATLSSTPRAPCSPSKAGHFRSTRRSRLRFTGIWSRRAAGRPILGATTASVLMRGVGDCGSDVRADASQATQVTEAARRILVAVSDALPEDFARIPDA